MLDLIAFLAVTAVNRVLHIMPMEFNLWLGRSSSGIFYALSGKRKMITYANIRAAFCHEKTPEEIRGIARDAYTRAAETFAELISMTKVDASYIKKYVSIKNFERVEEAAKNPNGMMLISAHFGNWELSLVTAAVKGFPLYILARDQKMKRLNELFNKLRESKGSVVVRKGADIKRLIRILQQGKSVGLLADQNAGMHGELLELFGRKASTAVGPYRIAQKNKAIILPAFIHRTKGPYHELIVEEPISIGEDEDILPYMEKYNRLMEKHIRQDPSQWFWMHKKWKMNPEKEVMVLDDGKKGHLNQSMAIVKEMKLYRQAEGHDPENLKVKVVSVNFKNGFHRMVFKIATPFLGRNCQGRPGVLRWALDKKSTEAVLSNYADIIISTGSGMACLNMMLKSENYARNVAVLDPGYFIRGKFDLVVVPRHDIRTGHGTSRKKKDNIVVTELAPNLISSLNAAQGKDGSGSLSPRKEKYNVGVLIGGDNKYFAFSEKLIKDVIVSLKELCDDINGYMHVTTSRRTSSEIEKIAENALTTPRCVTFTAGTKDKSPGTVERILRDCDILIVSLESISMVSEAVSSGKHVLAFSPEKKARKQTKYEIFAERLASQGYLTLAEPCNIAKKAKEVIAKKECPKLSEDGVRIREQLYRLF